MDTVIEVEGLRKEYRRVRGSRTVAVDGLDLAVPRGGVFGFLGPNGAGKTTTIRCLLGLVRPTGGRCRLLGQEPAGLHKVIGRVGSIVESPAMYPRFSARRNLELLGRISGIGRARVGEVLDEVGLAERADDQVKTYSLGMKQRLGIAGALLKDPGGPDPGRAGERARPGRDRRGARADADVSGARAGRSSSRATS